MERFRCLGQGSILLFVTLYLLLATPCFLYAGGKIYWTPDGVLIAADGSAAASPVDDTKGGAIILTYVGQAIAVQRVDRNGTLLWGENGKMVETVPAIHGGWSVTDGTGGAIIVWNLLWGWLFYQRVDSTGNKMWGNTGQRVTLSDSAQYYPALVSDGAKGMIIAWQERRGSQGTNFNWDIYAQRVDSTGNVRWTTNGVWVASSVNPAPPAIVSDGRGGIIIAWADLRSGNYDIYAQRLDSIGTKMWGEDIIVCAAGSGQYLYGSGITTDLLGGAIISWADKRAGNFDVYAQKVDSAGAIKWALNGVPICSAVGNQCEPVSIITDCRGGGIILWGDRSIPQNYNIYAQKIDSTGVICWLPNGVPICTADSIQQQLVMVSDSAGGAIIAWQDKRSGAWDIYAQHIDSLGNILWDTNGMPVCTAVGSQWHAAMTASDSGRAIISWGDARSGQLRGYAQKVGDEVPAISETRRGEVGRQGEMLQISPNPFRKATVIKFQIPNNESQMNAKSQSRIKIYNSAGEMVKAFDLANHGLFGQVVWDGSDTKGKLLPIGVYFCELRIDKQSLTKKIVLLR